MGFMFPTDWSRDGKTVMLSVAPSLSPQLVDIWYLALDPAGQQKALKAEPFIKTDRGEERGRLSPDGRWLAYQSDATGQYEIYVQPFPRSAERSGQFMVSNGLAGIGTSQPLWNRNGKELFYRVAVNGAVMAVDVSLGETFKSGQPKMLFMSPPAGQVNGPMFSWDVAPDGSKFLMNVVTGAADAGPAQSITLVQNWTSGLK
jgi:serine/threonine-protein kinase